MSNIWLRKLITFVHCRNYGSESFGLSWIQGQWLAGEDVLTGVGIALGNLGSNGDESFVFEAANSNGSRASEFKQLLERDFAALFDDVPDFFLAFGKPG